MHIKRVFTGVFAALLVTSTLYAQTVPIKIWQKDYQFADEGTYFCATNPTPGTGIASAAAPTTLDDTKPFWLLKNNSSTSSPKTVYLDFLKVIVTAAGTNGTNINFVSKTDVANSAGRYTSGGSTITPVNVNVNSGTATQSQVYAGAITAASASGSARLLDHIQLRPVIPVVGDTYIINFGQVDPAVGSLQVSGTSIANAVYSSPPVVVGAQQYWLGHLFLASQSAASSYEFTLCWVER